MRSDLVKRGVVSVLDLVKGGVAIVRFSEGGVASSCQI